MYFCNNCGADMAYDPESGLLVCEYCLNKITVQEYQAKEAATAEEKALSEEEASFYKTPQADTEEACEPVLETVKEKPGNTWQAYVHTCPQCGGRLLTYDDTAATFCSFCGASVILQSRVSDERKPDAIIPFTKTKEDCEKAYRKMLRRAVFIPNEMKKTEKIERFRGIYMPYWVYSFSQDDDIHFPGKRSHRSGDYILTDHFDISARVKAEFEGISFDASSSFSDNLSEAIAPFNYDGRKDFNPAYLSGFYADAGDVDYSVYMVDARRAAGAFAAEKLMEAKELKKLTVNPEDINTSLPLRREEPKLAFFPVWFLASRNRKGDRVSYAVVNGQTGRVAADLPVDRKKFAAGSIILAIPIFIILNILLTLTPSALIVWTAIIGFIALLLANRHVNLVYTAEKRADDKGFINRYGQDPDVRTKSRVKEAKENVEGKVNSAFGLFNITGELKSLILALVFIFAIIFLYKILSTISMAIAITVVFAFMLVFTVIGVISAIVMGIKSKNSKSSRSGKKKSVQAVAPFRDRIRVIAKPLAGIVLVLIVGVVNPVMDIFFYIACIIALILTAWCFWDILDMHNRLAARPLPQFGRRGGE